MATRPLFVVPSSTRLLTFSAELYDGAKQYSNLLGSAEKTCIGILWILRTLYLPRNIQQDTFSWGPSVFPTALPSHVCPAVRLYEGVCVFVTGLAQDNVPALSSYFQYTHPLSTLSAIGYRPLLQWPYVVLRGAIRTGFLSVVEALDVDVLP